MNKYIFAKNYLNALQAAIPIYTIIRNVTFVLLPLQS